MDGCMTVKFIFPRLAVGSAVLILFVWCTYYAAHKDLAVAADAQEIITIDVDPGALGTDLPDEASLVRVARALLREHFPQDVQKSHSARGKISLLDRKNRKYELIAIFLYRHTYTAVDHRVVFVLSNNQLTIVSID